MADVIICASKMQREIIRILAPELTNNLKVIYNPLPDLHLIDKKLEEPSFIYVGGGSYGKGFYTFLNATINMLREGYRANFTLAGSFKKKDRITINFLNKKFANHYNLVGWISRNELFQLYSKAYGLVFPSLWEEPLPYAVIEAMLAGTIPIASKVGGVPEIVQETCAEDFLFTAGNVRELTDKMELIMSMSREELIDIGIKLRENVLKKFNKDLIERELLHVFEQ
jgi:glycosyltransferase involved in cell wall biosynthesis